MRIGYFYQKGTLGNLKWLRAQEWAEGRERVRKLHSHRPQWQRSRAGWSCNLNPRWRFSCWAHPCWSIHPPSYSAQTTSVSVHVCCLNTIELLVLLYLVLCVNISHLSVYWPHCKWASWGDNLPSKMGHPTLAGAPFHTDWPVVVLYPLLMDWLVVSGTHCVWIGWLVLYLHWPIV